MGAFQAWKNSKGAGLPHGWLPPRWGAVGMIFSFFSGKQKKSKHKITGPKIFGNKKSEGYEKIEVVLYKLIPSILRLKKNTRNTLSENTPPIRRKLSKWAAVFSEAYS